MLQQEYKSLCQGARHLLLEEWGPALPYEPIGHLSTNAEMVAFFGNAPTPITRAAPARKPIVRKERPVAVAKREVIQEPPPELKRETVKHESSGQVNSLLQSLKELCPAIRFSDAPPSDEVAVRIAQGYKHRPAVPQTILIYPDEGSDNDKLFFDHLAQAIEICFGSARCFERSRLAESWSKIVGNPEVKLVIAAESTIKDPVVGDLYKDEMLGERLPVVLIESLEACMSSGKEKHQLWKQLGLHLSPCTA